MSKILVEQTNRPQKTQDWIDKIEQEPGDSRKDTEDLRIKIRYTKQYHGDDEKMN